MKANDSIENDFNSVFLPPGHGVVGESRDLGLALLDDGHGEDGQISVHDASTHRLTLALAGATGPSANILSTLLKATEDFY